VGRLFLPTLAMVAEFEANLGHLCIREGMALAKRQGKFKGKQPRLPESAQRSIRRRYATGEVFLAEPATEFPINGPGGPRSGTMPAEIPPRAPREVGP
jgi:DNA invertase Pin-like site-specific DNA recombinase